MSTPVPVERPRYDRGDLRPGIVHIGVGNFHRAHQAWYLHRLMQQGLAQDWAIIGAGVRPYDAAMRDKLLGQDCRTTLIELDPSGISAEITQPMIDYLPVEAGNGALIAQMADAAIRIVSLTVTESGYYIDPSTGGPDLAHPDIARDLAYIETPATAFGAIVRALQLRHAKGHKPFTVLSCDNLSGNGAITRALVVAMAERIDPVLAAWIEAEGAFPNSMVDCIVPATGPAEIERAQNLGLEDAAPVFHENYRQWVIEDAFCAGRPDWERVGVVLSDDVHLFETMKIRILNAGHQVLANAGELLSVQTVADCMAHDTIRPFFTKVQETQIVPTVAPVPDTTAEAYHTLIAERFSNPAIHDTIRRIAYDGSARHPGFVLPILADLLDQRAEIDGLCLVEALWARMCAGTRDDGSAIEPNDPRWTALNATALQARDEPRLWLEQAAIYARLAANDRVVDAFTRWLARLWANGTEATLRHYIETGGKATA